MVQLKFKTYNCIKLYVQMFNTKLYSFQNLSLSSFIEIVQLVVVLVVFMFTNFLEDILSFSINSR